jgi:hypothetical protein
VVKRLAFLPPFLVNISARRLVGVTGFSWFSENLKLNAGIVSQIYYSVIILHIGAMRATNGAVKYTINKHTSIVLYILQGIYASHIRKLRPSILIA